MKRKILALLIIFLFLLILPLNVMADEVPPLVVDNAGLFTEEERFELIEKSLTTLRDQYQIDVVILTVPSLDGKSPQDYADDFYDQNGYGYPNDDSGILFLISMEERDWYISTYGDAIYALTDYGIQASAGEALPYFSEDDYYGGFHAWLDVLPLYFEAYENGERIDGYADNSGNFYHGVREEILYYEEDVSPSILLSFLIGFVVAAATVLIMRSSMNTKRPKSSASDYLTPGSYRLPIQRDIFLYSSVRKTARPKETSSGGGGSSVHKSSSGRRHGGGGGKF